MKMYLIFLFLILSVLYIGGHARTTRLFINDLRMVSSKSMHRKNVEVYKLKKGGDNWGNALWLLNKHSTIQAKYLISESRRSNNNSVIYNRYQQLRNTEKVIFACTGGFSSQMSSINNENPRPVGLSAEQGRIINKNIEYKMDALVSLNSSGNIEVFNLNQPMIEISGKKFNVESEKTKFLNWVQKEGLTLFQTQLLAYNNELLIGRAGRGMEKERRFLALIENKKGQRNYILFDLPANRSLFDAALEVFYLLRNEGLTIQSLINLDTGAFNILEVFDENGERDFKVSGDMDSKGAPNLLVFYLNN